MSTSHIFQRVEPQCKHVVLVWYRVFTETQAIAAMQLLVNNITFRHFARRIHELTGKCCILIGREILTLSGDFAT